MEIKIYLFFFFFEGGEGVNNFCSTNFLTTIGEEFFEVYINKKEFIKGLFGTPISGRFAILNGQNSLNGQFPKW